MATIELTGRINNKGQIELDQPTDLPPGAAVHLTIETLENLPYDDDPAWNESFAKSLNGLQRLADKAKKNHAEGKTFSLDELLNGVTPENRHDEWDMGPAVGKETVIF